MSPDPRAFIIAGTLPTTTPLVPEIRLHLATELTPLWEATEVDLAANNLAPPYWAFSWVGGQAVARHLLDHPDLVAGLRVFDFASGSGIAALAAARAGAAQVTACDIDTYACTAIALNAEINGLAVTPLLADRMGDALEAFDVVLAGDVFYERPMADRAAPWLVDQARRGKLVLAGDPGRAYLPKSGLEKVAVYDVPTSKEIEASELRTTTVWRITGQ